MILIVGLGNPGKEYEHTRHNVGFMIIDALAEKLGATWSANTDAQALTAEGHIGEEKVLLVKPQTFMNLSGESVQALQHYFKVTPEHIFVVYDDADLASGIFRIRLDGSSGGHNGVQSIINHLGTEVFPHVRIGVSNPVRQERSIPAKDFVLGTFSGDEMKLMNKVIDHAVEAIEHMVTDGAEAAMSKWNKTLG